MLQQIDTHDVGYKIFFKESPCPMCMIDTETLQFFDINDAALQFYGYDREEFLKMTLADIRAANDNFFVFNNIRERVQPSFADMGVSSHRKKNGEIVYVHIYARNIEIKGKKIRLAMLMDENTAIVEEKKNKELTERFNIQQKRLDFILTSIDDVVWAMWADTHELIFTNSASEKVYGYSEADMMADKSLFYNIIHVDDRSSFYDSSNRMLTTGKADYEFRVVHKNGSIKYLRGVATLMKGEDGSPDICCGLNIDITKEKELQQKVTDEEEKLRLLIDHTDDLIWSVDINYKIVTVNKAYKDFIFRLTGREIGSGDDILTSDFPQEDLVKWRNYYERALKGEKFVAIEQGSNEGKLYRFITNFNPLPGRLNTIVGVSCFSRVITENA